MTTPSNVATSPRSGRLPPAHRIAARALRIAVRRGCPSCGQGDIWESWLKLRERCPRCGIAPARGEHDFFIGAALANFVVAELVVVVAFIVALIVMWPAPNWDALLWGTAALAVLAPIAAYPFTMSFWLAVDMIFRPRTR